MQYQRGSPLFPSHNILLDVFGRWEKEISVLNSSSSTLSCKFLISAGRNWKFQIKEGNRITDYRQFFVQVSQKFSFFWYVIHLISWINRARKKVQYWQWSHRFSLTETPLKILCWIKNVKDKENNQNFQIKLSKCVQNKKFQCAKLQHISRR